jgi:WD40 repeat protein
VKTALLSLGLLVALLASSLAALPGPVRVDRQGDPLPEGILARLGTVRLRAPGVGVVVAYSPDGRRIATGDINGVALWDARTGERLGFLPAMPEDSGHGNMTTLTFSPDGRDLVAGFEWGSVVACPLGGQAFRLVSGTGFDPHSVTYMPDGRRLVAVGIREVRIVDAGTGQLVRTWVSEEGEAGGWRRGPAFGGGALSPDGKVLALVGLVVLRGRCGDEYHRPDSVRLWDVSTGEELARVGLPVERVCFSPDGHTLAALAGTEVVLLDPRSGERRRGWEITPGTTEMLAFSPDGSLLTAGGFLHDVTRGEPLRSLGLATQQRGGSAAFTPDGRHVVVTSGANGVAEIQETLTGRPLLPFASHSGPIESLYALPGGKELATASSDGTVRVWTPRTGEHLRSFDVPNEALLAFGGRWFAHGNDQSIVVRDLATGAIAHRVSLEADLIRFVLSADGQTLLIHDRTDLATLTVRSVTTGRERCRLAVGEESVYGMALSPDGTIVAATDLKGRLQLWNATTGEVLCELERSPDRTCAAVPILSFSPDGKMLASWGISDLNVRLWDVARGRLLRQCTAPLAGGDTPGQIAAIGFSADGRTLATAGQDRTFRVWEVASLRERFRWEGDGVGDVCFVGSGLLAAAHSRADVLVLSLATPADAANEARPIAPKNLWPTLANEDAGAAFRAMRALVKSGPALVGEKLQAV